MGDEERRTIQWNTMQYNAIQCSAMQCNGEVDNAAGMPEWRGKHRKHASGTEV